MTFKSLFIGKCCFENVFQNFVLLSSSCDKNLFFKLIGPGQIEDTITLSLPNSFAKDLTYVFKADLAELYGPPPDKLYADAEETCMIRPHFFFSF